MTNEDCPTLIIHNLKALAILKFLIDTYPQQPGLVRRAKMHKSYCDWHQHQNLPSYRHHIQIKAFSAHLNNMGLKVYPDYIGGYFHNLYLIPYLDPQRVVLDIDYYTETLRVKLKAKSDLPLPTPESVAPSDDCSHARHTYSDRPTHFQAAVQTSALNLIFMHNPKHP